MRSLAAASLALILILFGTISLAFAQEDVPGTQDSWIERKGATAGSNGIDDATEKIGGQEPRHSPLRGEGSIFPPSRPHSFVRFASLLTNSGRSPNRNQKTDCNVHPLDTEAAAAARIARCAPQLGQASLTAIDRVSPVIEPPELLAKRKANNAAAAAAAAAGVGGGVAGGGDVGVPGPAA